MDKKMRQEISEWLPQVWKKEKHGAITQRLAACLIGISDQAIKKAGDKGAIQIYECQNTRLYSFDDCLLYKANREEVLKEVKLFEEDEKLRKENPEKYKKICQERHEIQQKEESDYYYAKAHAEEMDRSKEEKLEQDYEEAKQAEEDEHAEYQYNKSMNEKQRRQIQEAENIVPVMGGKKKFEDITNEEKKELYKILGCEEGIPDSKLKDILKKI